MEEKIKAKKFDTIALIRDIRDEIIKETHGMSFHELKGFISRELDRDKKLNSEKNKGGQ